MNLLVTGGAGYIGGTVSTILVQAGHKVTVLDNLCHSKRHEVPSVSSLSNRTYPTDPRLEALLVRLKPDWSAALRRADRSRRVAVAPAALQGTGVAREVQQDWTLRRCVSVGE